MTSSSGSRAAAAAGRLRQALEHAAAALASPDLDALLKSECAIESALADLPSHEALSPDDVYAVRAELERARSALMRCRRLGAALNDFIRLSLAAQGGQSDYGPRADAAAEYAGRALNTRV